MAPRPRGPIGVRIISGADGHAVTTMAKELQHAGKHEIKESKGDLIASIRTQMDAMLDRMAGFEQQLLDAPLLQGLSIFPHLGQLELRPFGSLLESSALAEGWREPFLNWELEDDKRLLVNIELPGVKKEDINLDVGPDHLRLECEGEGCKYKAFLEPGMSLDPSHVNARYENGLLKLRIDLKADAAERVRHIAIK